MNKASYSGVSSEGIKDGSWQDILNKQRPDGYTSDWAGSLKETVDQILNRKPFSYDYSNDPLYQQYRDQYIRLGNLAMQDTMGQASALTGGYGNSYAQTVGQQTYQGYMQQLNNVIPELYGMAYNRYMDAGNELYNQANLLGSLDDRDYSRYRDDVSDWYADRDFYSNEEQKSENRQDNNYGRLWNLISSTGYNPTDKELAAAGMTRDQADALFNVYDKSRKDADYSNLAGRIRNGYNPTGDDLEAAGMTRKEADTIGDRSTADTQNSLGIDNGSYSNEVVRWMQRIADVDIDGMWGPDSKAAGGIIEDAVSNALEDGATEEANAFLATLQDLLNAGDKDGCRAKIRDSGLSDAEKFWLLVECGLLAL